MGFEARQFAASAPPHAVRATGPPAASSATDRRALHFLRPGIAPRRINPEHGTSPLSVPLELYRPVRSGQYRTAARCPTPKPVRLRTCFRVASSGRTGPRQRLQGQGSNMQQSKSSAYRAFQAVTNPVPLPRQAAEKVRPGARSQPSLCPAREPLAFPPLAPYQRCTCGLCRECRDNAKWDRIFAKFEVKEQEVYGLFRCALKDL